MPTSASQRGLIGNRLPTLDPKTAGMVGSQGQRKVSDNKGLFGNRIPSSSSSGMVPAPNAPASGGNVGVKTGTSVRSNSPGSVDSSNYQPGSSNSPHTSRSSSPPTSYGGGLPPSLLTATLPETGGPGTTTPSSTRADIGEEVTELSPPSTPIAAAEMPQDESMIRSDLTANNLPANAVAANPMLRTLSSGPAPSITSSVVSQFDSKGGSEDQNKMMQDVSGISTPMGTPRAAGRDLEGSVAGSVRGGSVADIDDLGSRLEGLDTNERDEGRKEGSEVEGGAELGGEDTPEVAQETPEEVKEEDIEMTNEGMKSGRGEQATRNDKKEEAKSDANTETNKEPSADDVTHNPQGVLQNPEAKIEYTVNDHVHDDTKESTHKSINKDRDPNLDDDLDALKAGELEHDKPSVKDLPNQSAADSLAGSALELGGDVEPRVKSDETKHQGGVAGQRMQETENADQVIQPDDETNTGNADDGPEIRDATPANDVAQDEGVPIENGENLGPRGTLDGPQKFEVEFLEKGRGQEKAAELDQKEYHFSEKTEGGSEKSEAPIEDGKEGEEQKTGDRNGDSEQDVPESISDSKAAEQSSTPESKPVQVQIEPAPIAQPATELAESSDQVVPDTSDEPTPSVEIDPPTFPAPPSEDPDVVDPISNADSGTTTPLDPSIAKTFPDVPDEEKPRVQVHVSSPLNTPQKEKVDVASSTTPLADLPGKSKSLSSLAAESEPSEDDHSDTPEATKHKRRLSARKSPKSPLLDDEDPGDFEPGEGWAVVTK